MFSITILRKSLSAVALLSAVSISTIAYSAEPSDTGGGRPGKATPEQISNEDSDTPSEDKETTSKDAKPSGSPSGSAGCDTGAAPPSSPESPTDSETETETGTETEEGGGAQLGESCGKGGAGWEGVNKWDADILKAQQVVYEETGKVIPCNVVKAIMKIESDGNENATRHGDSAGYSSFGLMQVSSIWSGTPKYNAYEGVSGYDSILGGMRYLADNSSGDDWAGAMSSYLGGDDWQMGTSNSEYVSVGMGYLNELNGSPSSGATPSTSEESSGSGTSGTSSSSDPCAPPPPGQEAEPTGVDPNEPAHSPDGHATCDWMTCLDGSVSGAQPAGGTGMSGESISECAMKMISQRMSGSPTGENSSQQWSNQGIPASTGATGLYR